MITCHQRPWTLTAAAIALLLTAHVVARADAQASAAPHLRIVGAQVENIGSANGDIARRRVRFGITLTAAPECSARSSPEYGFLVDADRSRTTGVTHESLALGIDARLVIRCNAVTGMFESPIGNVNVTTAAGETRLLLQTTVGRLPSVDLFWAPYAAEGGRVTLLPDLPRHSRWAIAERSSW